MRSIRPRSGCDPATSRQPQQPAPQPPAPTKNDRDARSRSRATPTREAERRLGNAPPPRPPGAGRPRRAGRRRSAGRRRARREPRRSAAPRARPARSTAGSSPSRPTGWRPTSRGRRAGAAPPPRRGAASTPLAPAISDAWPSRPKPVMSVQAWTAPAGSAASASAAAGSAAHDLDGLVDDASSRTPVELDGGPDHAGAERLGQEQHVARPRAGVRQDARRGRWRR